MAFAAHPPLPNTRSGELDYDGAGQEAMRPRMRELAREVPNLLEDIKRNLRALVAHYVVRALPMRARECVDDMWVSVGKLSMRELMSDCDEPEIVEDIANRVVDDCHRIEIRTRMRTSMLSTVLAMTHDQYVAFLEDPGVCMEWFFDKEPKEFRDILDTWTTELMGDAMCILDEKRRRREARLVLVRAEEAEKARRADKQQREAEAKKSQRARKQQQNAEKQREARQAREAKEEARAAKWRIGSGGSKRDEKTVPAFFEDDIYPSSPAAAPPVTPSTPPPRSQAAVPSSQAAAVLTECRVCMEDVRGCAIAFPCGHNQVCDTCAAALVRDKLLACVQCMEPVCMYVSHDGECLCS